VEFSSSDIHSTIVAERMADLQEEAEHNRLAQHAQGLDADPRVDDQPELRQGRLRARLGRGLIVLGHAIEGSDRDVSPPHASNDPQAA
jgi:hypothetical protein